MENKVLSILLGGLIVAVIFHALASRYELQRGGRDIAYRIDRLTGKVWECYMTWTTSEEKYCYGGRYNDTYPLPKK